MCVYTRIKYIYNKCLDKCKWYVYIYVYIYISVYKYKYTYKYVSVYAYIKMYTNICI